MERGRIKKLTLCALFAALIAAGAFIRIPFPYVPVTLQAAFVTLAGLLLGARDGMKSALIYMVLGLIGLPVFAQGGGIGYIFNPSFGYIIGFLPGAFITGKIAHSAEIINFLRRLSAGFAGLAIIYAAGTIYYCCITSLYLEITLDVRHILTVCLITVLPGDVIMTIGAVILAERLSPIIRKKERRFS